MPIRKDKKVTVFFNLIARKLLTKTFGRLKYSQIAYKGFVVNDHRLFLDITYCDEVVKEIVEHGIDIYDVFGGLGRETTYQLYGLLYMRKLGPFNE